MENKCIPERANHSYIDIPGSNYEYLVCVHCGYVTPTKGAVVYERKVKYKKPIFLRDENNKKEGN